MRIYQDNARPWYVTGTCPATRVRPAISAARPIAACPSRGRRSSSVLHGGERCDLEWGCSGQVPHRGRHQSCRRAQRPGHHHAQHGGQQYRCYLGGDPRLKQESWPNSIANAWNRGQGRLGRHRRRLEAPPEYDDGTDGRTVYARPDKDYSGPSTAPITLRGKA